MRFNRSIFLSFLWSYLLLMGIVISIVSAVFISRFSAQKEELRNSYQNTLNVMTESISVQLDRCMVLLDEYVLDVHASALINAAQATDVHTRENILALHRTLANNVSWQDICRQVTYLFGKMGLALSNTGSCEMENCYKLYFCNAFGSMEEWIRWTASLQTGMLYAGADGSVYMGTALPLLGGENRQCAVVLKLNEKNLFAPLLSSQPLFNGALEVCDSLGNPLYAIGDTALLKNESDARLFHFQAQDHAARFILRSAVERDLLFASAISALRFYLIVLLLCIVLGVAVSLGMSARFYQPVRRIASMMGGWKGRTNEIRHIEQSIQQIMNEREQLSSSLQRHSGDLLECEFRRVINGEADESQMQTLIEHELAPQGQGLVSLVLLGPEGVSRKQMSQLLETVLSRRVRCRCFTTGQLVAGLAVAEDRAAVKAQLQAAFDEMSAVCPGTFCLAVSEIVRSPQAVKASHQQAMEALDMLITTRGSGLFFADELPPSHGRADSSITLYDHMRLQDAIRSGSREEALRIFHWMTEKYFPPEGVPLPWLKCRMFSLVHTLVSAAPETHAQLQDESPLERLMECSTISDMIGEAEQYLQAMCSLMQPAAASVSPSPSRDQVMDYIKSHYQNPELSVSSIADHFQMNASYLSRLFKQTTGKGVLDAIHAVRIARAKELLWETHMPLHAIQTATGFPSEQTMLRAFKREEGMTPSQFRQLHQQNA